MSVCVTERGRNQFPSVLLHPPPLACESSASYSEMSRRSGYLSAGARSAKVDAALADDQFQALVLELERPR